MQFTPETFSMLVDGSQLWFEFLMRMTRQRTSDPEGIESQLIPLIIRDRARRLRN
jgi:hypothetical protein